MRKIIFLMHISLDGFVADAQGSLDWIRYDKELEDYSHSLHESTDAAIYGRVTYEMMQSYWSTVLDNPESDEGARNHALWLESSTKVVVSRTLDKLDWGKTHLIKDNLAQEFKKLKAQEGKDLWLLASPTLARSMMNLGLIDEFRLNVNPVILGSGTPLFDSSVDKQALKLIESKHFSSGVVGLRYEPA